MSKKTALVIGAGAFGTSIATVVAPHFENVVLKVRSQDVYEGIEKGENTVYLPGNKLAENITAALSWDEVEKKSKGVDLIIWGLPTSAIRPFIQQHLEKLEAYLKQGIPVVSLTKGIDPDTLELVDDLFFDYFANYKDQFTFLSGPSFAGEIMDEQITLVSLAGRSRRILCSVGPMLERPFFKVMYNYDIKGVLLGGALKNILAIAGGIIDGLGYNHNTRAAMITRGIAEMLRFGTVFNARPETFYGLSGMGDLILTTTGDLSRNRSFGIEIAKGRSPEEIINSQRSVVEGYKTTKAAHFLAENYDIRARIFNGLYEVLYNLQDPRTVIREIMKAPTRFEIE